MYFDDLFQFLKIKVPYNVLILATIETVFIIVMVFLIESIKKYLKQGNQKLNIATPITKYSIYFGDIK